MTEQVGRVLGERYRLLSPLGSGASAEVYLADDVRLRRRVAVKILHAALADDAAFLRRFRAEARAVAALSHPNIVAVFDWSGDERPYLVTEYLRGGSLRSMLDEGHRLSPSQALVVGMQAAQALDFAHRRGFVHRDIKPANLLLGGDSRLRIADFGLARATAEAALTEPGGAVLGTARYASPEQARGEPLTGRSDVYSLGLVLIEAVTGSVPFATDTTIGTLMARVEEPIDVPAALSALAPVLGKAGAVSPELRPDAATLVEELKDSAVHLPRPAALPLAALSTQRTPGAGDDPTLIGAATTSGGRTSGDTADDAGRVVTEPLAAVGTSPSRSASDSGGTSLRRDDGRRPGAGTAPRSDGAGGTGRGTPPPRRAARRQALPRSMLSTLVVLVALAAGAAGAWFFQQASVPSHVVPVELIGAQFSDINQHIGEYGWPVEQREEFRDQTEAGEILETDPQPGSSLREGETLTVVVSRGPPLVDVPQDLAGLTPQKAEDRLRDSGLTLGELVPRESHELDDGVVIGVAEGTELRLPKGSAVQLLVSTGPPAVTIPSLEGRRFEEARDALRELGLDVDRERERNDDFPPDRVIRTEPGAGSEVQPGDTVTVIVSQDGGGRDDNDDNGDNGDNGNGGDDERDLLEEFFGD